MSTFKPKSGTDKQDISAGYMNHSCFHEHPDAEIDQNNPDGGTPFSWVCGDCSYTIPSGAGILAQSVVTPKYSSPGTPALGFQHFDGLATTETVWFPNTITGSSDYTAPGFVENGNGTLTTSFVDGNSATVNICDVINSHCTLDCPITVNAGLTSTDTDASRGTGDVTCGETIHVWSSERSIDFAVSAGATSVTLEADVRLAGAQAGQANQLSKINGQGLYLGPQKSVLSSVNTGHTIATHSPDGIVVATDIEESITTLTLGSDGESLDYLAEGAGAATNVNLCSIVTKCETLTSISFNPSTNVLTYNAESGTTNLSLNEFECADLNSCSIDALGDVITPGPNSGDILEYNGAAWVDTPICTAINDCSIDALGDVVTPSPNSGDVLQYDGTNWVDVAICTAIGDCNLNALGDVVTPSSNSGDVLQFDGSNWVDIPICTTIGACSIDALSDVNTTTSPPDQNQVLAWNSGVGEWRPANPVVVTFDTTVENVSGNWPGGSPGPSDPGTGRETGDLHIDVYDDALVYFIATGADTFPNTPDAVFTVNVSTIYLDGDSGSTQTISNGDTITVAGGTGIDTVTSATDTVTITLNAGIDDLTDVDTTTVSPTSGQYLGWDGSQWEPVTHVFAEHSIDDLTDVDTTTISPVSGQVLVWDGTQWEPGTLPSGQLTSFSVDGKNASSVAQTINDGDTLLITGSAGLDTIASGTDILRISYDLGDTSLLQMSGTIDVDKDRLLFYDNSVSGHFYVNPDQLYQPPDTYDVSFLESNISANYILGTGPSGSHSTDFLSIISEDYLNGVLLSVEHNSGGDPIDLFVEDNHSVTYSSPSGDYDVGADAGSSNRPTNPIEGDEVIEIYDNGLLQEIYDGSEWVSVFSSSCCPDPTIALTDGAVVSGDSGNQTFSPTDEELPTTNEVQTLLGLLGSVADGPGTQVTYTSPRGSYFTWVLDGDGDPIEHERRFRGGAAPDVTVDASAAANQAAFDALMPTAYPEGYDKIHIYVNMGAKVYTLDNFLVAYTIPDGIKDPTIHVHNTTSTTGAVQLTMPVTGNTVSFASDDIVTLGLNGAGAWTIEG